MATRSKTSRKRISSKDVGAPALLKTETRPPGRTLYVDIDLGVRGKPPQCAIFIPAGFGAGPRIDVVLYLHGFNIPDGALSIDQYLKQDYGKLREGVNASGRNVVLIAPTLGAKSQAGALVRPGGLDDFLGKSLAAIQVHGQLTGLPKVLAVGALILAGHSGGGKPIREIAGGKDDALTSLEECWCYDALNSPLDVPFWSDWVRGDAAKRLRLYYLPNGTPVAKRCEALAALQAPNLIATKSRAADHMHVPITDWANSLRGASVLAARPGPAAPDEPAVA